MPGAVPGVVVLWCCDVVGWIVTTTNAQSRQPRATMYISITGPALHKCQAVLHSSNGAATLQQVGGACLQPAPPTGGGPFYMCK